jgi:hypothetical protein
VRSQRRKALLSLLLVLVALLEASDWLLLNARGSHAPAWAHWWCSATGSSPLAGHASHPPTSLFAHLTGALSVLLPHWPHVVPIVVALATLVYLHRANARYHSSHAQMQTSGL